MKTGLFLIVLLAFQFSLAATSYICRSGCLQIETKDDHVNLHGPTRYILSKTNAHGEGATLADAYNALIKNCTEKKGTHLVKVFSSQRIMLYAGEGKSAEVLENSKGATSENACHSRVIAEPVKPEPPAPVSAQGEISPAVPAEATK